jgi:hypothetical protein
MRRFPSWLIVVVCFGYMIALTAVTLAWLQRWARIEARAHGMNDDNFFVMFPLRTWWFALLVLPPVAFVVAWLWSRWAAPTH